VAVSIPEDSVFHSPASYMEDALEFIASEITSESVEKELRKMTNVFPWIDDDRAPTYFELTINTLPDYMSQVTLIASKTYTRGLVIISIYYDRCIYFLLQSGEGDQPLLDVRFPDVSKHGQGLHVNAYGDNPFGWKKLTLWHIIDSEPYSIKKEFPKLKTINISSKNYEQTYCILKSAWDLKTNQLSVHHDALFRFGSWCYAGRVQLTAVIGLHDVPFVIPALRMQQSRLDFYCDVNQMPITSPFAAALNYIHEVTPCIEYHIQRSETTLEELIDRLSNMGLGDAVRKWLEGESSNSFFEFKLSPSSELIRQLQNIEIIVSKNYHASGIITITIFFQFTIYVCLLETSSENPLLDSKFPDVSGKGRGYQLEAFNSGTEDWPELRKVSIWQTMGALEQEFREKVSLLAADKVMETDDKVRRSESEKDLISADGKPSENESQSESEKNIEEWKADVIRPTPSSIEHRIYASEGGGGGPELTADEKLKEEYSPSKAVKDVNENSKSNFTNTSTRPKQALPHHLPKLDSLVNKLDDIRKNVGDTVSSCYSCI
jgi:hypothetical protein